jgi:hypothetical protein
MVDSTRGGWTQAHIDSFARSLIDDDPDNDRDIFPRIWNYYCHGDSAPEYDAVRFVVNGKTYTRIRTDIYFQEDCCINTCGEGGCPSSWSSDCKRGNFVECGGYGVYRGQNRLVTTGGLCPADRPDTPEFVARSSVWSHELAHLCDKANKRFIDPANSELLATGAEYLSGERWNKYPDNPRATEYDVSLMTGNPNNLNCNGSETRCKYNQYRLFNAYLFEHFSGSADSLDLVYRWMRYQEDGKYLTSFRGLGNVLMEPPFAERIEGETPAEKMGNLYQRFAMARFADEPHAFDGRFGFGPEVSPRFMRFFEWHEKAALARSRVVPPVIRIRADAAPDTVTEWQDSEQPSAEPEPLRVVTTGTDYILFVADSASFAGDDRTLRIRILGTGPVPANQSFRLGTLSYDRPRLPLYDQVPIAAVEDVGGPSLSPADTLDVEFTVDGFGGETQAVAVVFSMVEATLSESFWGVEDMDYRVVYSLD